MVWLGDRSFSKQEQQMTRPVKAHFEQLSDTYGENFAKHRSGTTYNFRERARLVLDLLGACSGNLLDCASGSGEITAAVLQTGQYSRATIIDISGKMLASAKQRVNESGFSGEVTFLEADVFRYRPISEEKYDVILCLGLIAHTGRLEELLRQLKAMLSPDGVILLQTTLYDHFGVKVVRWLTDRRYVQRHGYRISYFRGTDIAASCALAGLAIRQLKRYCFGLPFGDKIFPLGNYWVEILLGSMAKRMGSEGIYLLVNRED
jgi:2-polyprenyl-3-methyl-5-hydroxy-6-metoxy-1,4-benzoquinol methylase